MRWSLQSSFCRRRLLIRPISSFFSAEKFLSIQSNFEFGSEERIGESSNGGPWRWRPQSDSKSNRTRPNEAAKNGLSSSNNKSHIVYNFSNSLRLFFSQEFGKSLGISLTLKEKNWQKFFFVFYRIKEQKVSQ